MRRGELHSAESRAKISASKAGKRFTEQHVEAIRKALAGRPKSPSHKKAIAEGIRSARLARQQMSITTLQTESMKDTSNQKGQKRIFKTTIHYTDKQFDLNDLNRAVDTYADWKIKAYLREQNAQDSTRIETEEDW